MRKSYTILLALSIIVNAIPFEKARMSHRLPELQLEPGSPRDRLHTPRKSYSRFLKKGQEENVNSDHFSLLHLLEKLRVMIHGCEFDSSKFAAEAPDLQLKLSRLSDPNTLARTASRLFDLQCKYASILFQRMSRACSDLAEVNTNDAANQLVRNMIKLNVAILKAPLRDNYSDSELADYSDTVKWYISLFNRWNKEFEQMQPVRESLKVLFTAHKTEAEHTLELLEKYTDMSL